MCYACIGFKTVNIYFAQSCYLNRVQAKYIYVMHMITVFHKLNNILIQTAFYYYYYFMFLFVPKSFKLKQTHALMFMYIFVPLGCFPKITVK